MSWIARIPVPKQGKLPIGMLTFSSVVTGIVMGTVAAIYYNTDYYLTKEVGFFL